MTKINENSILWLAFLTAAASSLQIVENLILRLLPLPFIRIGLSNVVILYLIYRRKSVHALVVAISKSILGGLFTFTLLTPSTLLSLSGGLAAFTTMVLARQLKLGLSIYGVSILGAIAHNMMQLYLVHRFIIESARVFVLTPLLLSIALLNGGLIAYLTIYIDKRIQIPQTGVT